MRSLKGLDDKCIVSNCRLPQTSFRRNKVFSVGRPELAMTSLLKGAEVEKTAIAAPGTAAVAPETTALAVVKNDRQTTTVPGDVTDATEGGGRAAAIIVPAVVTDTSPPGNNVTGPEIEDDEGSLITSNDLEGRHEQSQIRDHEVCGGEKTRSETEEKIVNAAQPTKDIVLIRFDLRLYTNW